MQYFNFEEIQKLDDLAVENGLEIRQMMELAGWRMIELLRVLRINKKKVCIVCGKGNKAGDGLAAARHLVNNGWIVEVILLSRDLSVDAGHQLKLLKRMEVSIFDFSDDRMRESLERSYIVIDALIGYNLQGAPRDNFAKAIDFINRSGKVVISYDLSSGLDPTTGKCPDVCVKANITLTLAVPKKAFEREEGLTRSGDIYVGDIGIPEFIYNQVRSNSRPNFKGNLIALSLLLN